MEFLRLRVFFFCCFFIGMVNAQWLEEVIPVGHSPIELVWTATNNKVYCVNEEGTVTVIDGASNSVIATIGGLGVVPRNLAWDSLDNKIYCADYGFTSSKITAIDCATDSVITSIVIEGITGASDLVWNSIDNKLYCAYAGSNCVVVIDCNTDTILTVIPVGDTPRDLVYNPQNDKIYCANCYSDNVTVIDGRNDSVIATIPVGHQPVGLYWHRNTNEVYCSNHGGGLGGSITVIDGRNNNVVATIGIGGFLDVLTGNLTNNKVYCGMWTATADYIVIIDAFTHSVIDLKGARMSPCGILWNSINNKVYVHHNSENLVMVMDGVTNSTIELIRVPAPAGARYAECIAWNRINNRIYVTNYDDDSVSVIRDEVGIEETTLPTVSYIFQTYPNPFRDIMHIKFQIPKTGSSIKIFDYSGRLVRFIPLATGFSTLTWDGTDDSGRRLPEGIYFITIENSGLTPARVVKIK